MIKVQGMLMVGAFGRDVGKTRLACALIDKFCSRGNVVGIKVTAIDHVRDSCPRGGDGCGVCSALQGPFQITEEIDRKSGKDTCKMLAAGAKKVYWLRVLKSHLDEGVEALMEVVGEGSVFVCESNSLRLAVEPDVFILVKAAKSEDRKPSIEEVIGYADRVVTFDGEIADGRWSVKSRATAIIMAGGASSRMGQDKSMLPIEGESMIEHIYGQLEGNFSEIIISSNEADKHGFLGVKVVADRVTGQGPLMGIASALEESANDLNFVLACDIPRLDIDFVRGMLRGAGDFDAVIPRRGADKIEPLFGVYNKSILGNINKALEAGKRRVSEALEASNVKYVDISDIDWLTNINTVEDYQGYIGSSDSDIV
ncbi:MAG: NTP transferase domain-containing protein [Planctomycetes bacterium]|nr:NTP transferase domain-containing protein [Planctomycetota bacterium]